MKEDTDLSYNSINGMCREIKARKEWATFFAPSPLHKFPDQFRIRVHLKGVINILHVIIDGVVRQLQLGGDLFAAEPAQEQGEDGALARRKTRDRAGREFMFVFIVKIEIARHVSF